MTHREYIEKANEFSDVDVTFHDNIVIGDIPRSHCVIGRQMPEDSDKDRYIMDTIQADLYDEELLPSMLKHYNELFELDISE